jgi:hypothetical protein
MAQGRKLGQMVELACSLQRNFFPNAPGDLRHQLCFIK